MFQPYDHTKIESKWKEIWKNSNPTKAEDFSPKPKKYILAEFPYPSGAALHAGHMMRYTVPDVYSRWLRMNGHNVLFPMGWDAFGLPAENYAIKTGVHPSITTKKAIQSYKESIQKMGYGVDWDREINTTDPEYYKWTQWLFLKFFENNLAEYKEMPVWWCENLKTVLSDEEILTDKNGNKISERGEHPVERKMIKQWVLKITKYAEKLIDGLNEVDFPEAVKQAQLNWIGKKEGLNISYNIDGMDESITCFTTRPDTNFGATFIVLAPEHPFCAKVTSIEAQAYIAKAKSRSELERISDKKNKSGVFTGFYAINSLNGKKLPIWVSDFVLAGFGTGAVVGVPGHDQRDYDFAKTFNLEIIEVVKPTTTEYALPFEEDGICVNSDFLNGLTTIEAKEKISEYLEKTGAGKKSVTYNLRDWVFSRQRYWGEPIPVIHTPDGQIHAIALSSDPTSVNKVLPLTLPEVPDYSPSSDGTSPLARNSDWVKTTDNDGNPATRETNTMPNWAGSSWYYLRYIDPHNNEEFASAQKLKYWLPVDKYFGGSEHTTMHLLYSRFWHKFFYDLGIVPTKEPYAWRLNGGTLLGPDGRRMSKSRGNVVEPMNVVDGYGADSLRLFVCFLGPYDETYPWNDNGVKSCYRLVKNVYDLQAKLSDNVDNEDKQKQLKIYNKTVKKITDMIEKLKVNTVVSEYMIFVNQFKDFEHIDKEVYMGFIKLFAPLAPFVSEEIWQTNFANKSKYVSVHNEVWPTYAEEYLVENTYTLPIQINGKVKANIEVTTNINQTELENIIKTNTALESHLKGKTITKVIFVPGKIVNLLVK